jgi:hypothetical protein
MQSSPEVKTKHIRILRHDDFNFFFDSGIHCILHVKENQFVVGSGDGAVSLVEDLSSRLRPTRRSSVVSKTVQEPTSSCLREVWEY